MRDRLQRIEGGTQIENQSETQREKKGRLRKVRYRNKVGKINRMTYKNQYFLILLQKNSFVDYT